MITLYEKDATTFESNGICILTPSSCIVTEIAGGEYELELEHPFDDNHKYLMLTEERLIKAPVPKTVIPETQLPQVMVWRVVGENGTDLYSRLPYYTITDSNWQILNTVYQHSEDYRWFPHVNYNVNAIVLYDGIVYRAKVSNIGITPGASSSSTYWQSLGSVSSGQYPPTLHTGTVLEHLVVNTTFQKIADKGNYMQVRTNSGRVGFVMRDIRVTEVEEQPPDPLPRTTITEQVFRIYETGSDEETNTYIVKAKHISYDFMSNSLYDCKVTNVKAGEAIAAIQGSLVMDDNRQIATNIVNGRITQDWSFKNPINALLDPDSGLVGRYGAKIIRNNQDFYILKPSNPRQGITISYGANMLGVNWTRNIENVVTRVIPRSGSADKGYTYISDGGRLYWDNTTDEWKIDEGQGGLNYVESSIADQYQVPRVAFLNCSYTVGQKYENADGSTSVYTEQNVIDKMLSDAMEKFTKDKVDGVDLSLEVEFLLLGDTEEYKQYRGLQWVSLYDVVRIKTGKSQIDVEAQVTEYEYDCLRGRYNSIRLGTINSFTKRIAGYRFINGSITYDKLSPDLIDRIVSSNASASLDSRSIGDVPRGGGVSLVVDALDSTETDIALSANMGRVLNQLVYSVTHGGSKQGNKVWATDANGEPGWRNISDLLNLS